MTRIIAGFAGSLTLRVPKSGTRPTSDRVREAIFSALEARDAIEGAVVLDLYAGSGALGLEAASRGARMVRLVERSAAAAQVARRNASAVVGAATADAPDVNVVVQAVRPYLERGGAADVDLVFIDPPYELGEAELAADLVALLPWLVEDAVVVVERSSRTPEPAWPAGLEPERRKDYGETVVWWAQPTPPSQPR
ncbi:16S rRNA (guanine(966)-N(2))-methyltransferase RsmD [Microbacteriaceae bacterium VKM Ac-2855]|nr:16S rRNA (guanine(966)-N(2))-methyltransferase RsmD [Microbacteriaceae bacterium VKM Ac-2855]